MSEAGTTQRRTAFVTGGSYGIGAAIANALSRDGFDVAVADLDIAMLENTVASIRGRNARVLAVQHDLRIQSSIEESMQRVLAEFGHLDVLVNNAGCIERGPVVEMTRQQWANVMDVNLTGTYFMSQAMGRHLLSTGRKGCIISIASTHGAVGVPNFSIYGISKAGIAHMTRMLAIEWAKNGIRVNAIAPGTTMTPSRAAALAAQPERRQGLLDRIPAGRFCTEEEIAALASFLASPQAEYITGQTLLVDGGLTSY
jgi:NAD(P)-dependent dehydrogenase (short-subunit alcohol dehydrogenase family)